MHRRTIKILDGSPPTADLTFLRFSLPRASQTACLLPKSPTSSPSITCAVLALVHGRRATPSFAKGQQRSSQLCPKPDERMLFDNFIRSLARRSADHLCSIVVCSSVCCASWFSQGHGALTLQSSFHICNLHNSSSPIYTADGCAYKPQTLLRQHLILRSDLLPSLDVSTWVLATDSRDKSCSAHTSPFLRHLRSFTGAEHLEAMT